MATLEARHWRGSHLLTVTWGGGSTGASVTLGVLGGGQRRVAEKVQWRGLPGGLQSAGPSCASVIKTKLNFRLVQ